MPLRYPGGEKGEECDPGSHSTLRGYVLSPSRCELNQGYSSGLCLGATWESRGGKNMIQVAGLYYEGMAPFACISRVICQAYTSPTCDLEPGRI